MCGVKQRVIPGDFKKKMPLQVQCTVPYLCHILLVAVPLVVSFEYFLLEPLALRSQLMFHTCEFCLIFYFISFYML